MDRDLFLSNSVLTNESLVGYNLFYCFAHLQLHPSPNLTIGYNQGIFQIYPMPQHYEKIEEDRDISALADAVQKYITSAFLHAITVEDLLPIFYSGFCSLSHRALSEQNNAALVVFQNRIHFIHGHFQQLFISKGETALIDPFFSERGFNILHLLGEIDRHPFDTVGYDGTQFFRCPLPIFDKYAKKERQVQTLAEAIQLLVTHSLIQSIQETRLITAAGSGCDNLNKRALLAGNRAAYAVFNEMRSRLLSRFRELVMPPHSDTPSS